jgi:exopolyphosphatase/guanosine-5'-triphosphate,3'-diphosphate pyrophosphatase
LRLAAIDIGSNAARLLISEVVVNNGDKPVFNKLNLIRVPLRLGFDVFETRTISPEKEDMIIKTLQSYKYLLEVYKVSFYKACATSAMRDATNAKDILARVLGETGIKIEVLTGDEEASVIYENHIAENLNANRSYLYIDVGGGSTEVTLFSNNEMAFKQSFDIGTIRLLKNQVQESHWLKMKEFIKDKTKGQRELVAIGTGGNINKVFSLSKKKDGKPLHIELLKDYFKEFSNFNIKDRMKIYNLREDRADVIVPALQIFVNVMRWANANEIFVPKIGLADGLIQHLYQQVKLKEIEV